MQEVLEIDALPESSLAASTAFYRDNLADAVALLVKAQATALVIVLPSARANHDDWRRALARDLARKYTPKRVNVIGVDDKATMDELLAYLRDAPGVTGQYLAAHE